MIIIIVLILLALVLWITLKPSWLPTLPESQATTAIADQASSAYSGPKNWWTAFTARWSKEKDLVAQYQQWVADTPLEKQKALYTYKPDDITAFRSWLVELPEEQLAAFGEEVAAFCRRLNVDLAWLTDSSLEGELKQIFEGAVLQYSLAIWQGHKVTAYTAYTNWLAAPQKKQNRAFAQKIYPRLLEAGLATMPAELLTASEKERQAHINEAIKQAAGEHPTSFMTLVEEIMAESEEAPAPEKKRPEIDEAEKGASPAQVVEGTT